MSQWVSKLFIKNYIKFSTLEMVFPSSETSTLLFRAIDLEEVGKKP
jgi:hypothetical protein